MKTYLITTLLSLFILTEGQSQVTREGQLDANLKVIQFRDGTLKFYKFDRKSKSLLIYNVDNTLWKSTNLAVTKSHKVDHIAMLEVYDGEGQNEFRILYTCYYPEFQPIEDVKPYFSKKSYTLNVVNEEGESLLKIPGTREYTLLAENGKNKLIVYKTSGKGFRTKRQLEVYAF